MTFIVTYKRYSTPASVYTGCIAVDVESQAWDLIRKWDKASKHYKFEVHQVIEVPKAPITHEQVDGRNIPFIRIL